MSDGLIPGLAAAMVPATPPGVQPGVSQAIQVANKFVAFGANGGLFVYSSTPAAGNLIGSVTGAASTDPYNLNTTPGGGLIGYNSFGGTFFATQIGSDGKGNSASALNFWTAPTSKGPWTEGPQVYTDTSGLLKLISATGILGQPNGSGFSGFVPVTNTDTSTNTNANNGTQPITAAYSINPSDGNAGTEYEIIVPFNGTIEGQTLGFKPYINGAPVVTSGGDVVAIGTLVAGSGFQGTVRMRLQVVTPGGPGVARVFIDGVLGTNAGRTSATQVALSSQNTGLSYNTGITNTLAVAAVWGAAAAGQTITGSGSDFTRKGF